MREDMLGQQDCAMVSGVCRAREGRPLRYSTMMEAGAGYQKLRDHWGSASLGESEKTSES